MTRPGDAEVARLISDAGYLPAGKLRAGTEEKLTAEGVLRNAHANGRLSTDQLKARIDHLDSLASMEDIQMVTRDLPEQQPAHVGNLCQTPVVHDYGPAQGLGIVLTVILTACTWIPIIGVGITNVWSTPWPVLPILGTIIGFVVTIGLSIE